MAVPKVVLCIPTYNRAALLRQSIQSILAQTFIDFKLIVVDDQSTDSTAAVVSALKDARVQYVRNNLNLGLTGNWNKCIDLALQEASPYIGIFHDDDYYHPEILAREIDFLTTHPRVGLVYSALYYYDSGRRRYFLRQPYLQDRVVNDLEMFEDLCRRGVYHVSTPCVLALRDAYAKTGNFDPAFKICPDLDLWWRMLEHYDMGYIADPLFIMRIHEQQTSSLPATHHSHALELELLLANTLRQLQRRYPKLGAPFYQKSLHYYRARQAIQMARTALINADYVLVDESLQTAWTLSHSWDIIIAISLFKILNNTIGRNVLAVVAEISRLYRSTSVPDWANL